MEFALAKITEGHRLAAAAHATAIGVGALSATCLVAYANGILALNGWGLGALSGILLAAPLTAAVLGRSLSTRHAALSAEHDDLRQQLDRDPLTHLLNRAAFHAELDRLANATSEHGTLIVLFFDLDRFKEVNDTLGHKSGDCLLIEVARRASNVLRNARAFARLGGDEFAAILPWSEDRSPEDHGYAVVEAMNEPFQIDGSTVEVSASVGIAIGDPLLDGGLELLRRADLAMYEAKGESRGGCRIYDHVLSGRQMRESSIRVELGKSMTEKSFTLHYQPLIDARTGRFSSAEALLRSQSNALGGVPTQSLIQIAEGSGQIIELTDWTLSTALDAIKKLENSPVAVNISPIYFRHPDFVHRICDKLLISQVPPELLTIEITEGVLIGDMAAARQSIIRLREIGINVYLDDFGTGYSSLSYLQHFELDGLKLDKSFLREVGEKRMATQIIRSIIDFGHSLEMRIVVEGVESDWQARLLQLLGADLLQGYELGVPMALDELIEFRADSLLADPAVSAKVSWLAEHGRAG